MRIKEDYLFDANKYADHVKELCLNNGITPEAAEGLAANARVSWQTGYIAAVSTIKEKVHQLCNQKQIIEYLENLVI